MKGIVKVALGVIIGLVTLGVIGVVLLGLLFGSVADELENSKSVESVRIEDSDNKKENSKENGKSKNKESNSQSYDQVLLEKDGVKVTLKTIEKITDDFWEEEYYEVKFDIKNNKDETIEVQAREVAIDGKMVDDMVFFSETVASNKSADGKMTIENYEGELPELKKELEFKLVVFGYDDYDFELQEPTVVKIK